MPQTTATTTKKKKKKKKEEVQNTSKILLTPPMATPSTATHKKEEEEEEEEEEKKQNDIEQPSSPTQALEKMFEDAQDAAYVVKKDVEELASSAADFSASSSLIYSDPETREDSPARPNIRRTSSRHKTKATTTRESKKIVTRTTLSISSIRSQKFLRLQKSVTDEITNAFSQVTSSIKDEFFRESGGGGNFTDPSRLC